MNSLYLILAFMAGVIVGCYIMQRAIASFLQNMMDGKESAQKLMEKWGNKSHV